MSDIHFKEKQTIRGKNYEFIFFNKHHQKQYDKKYVDMINTDPEIRKTRYVDFFYLVDKNGVEYRIKRDAIDNSSGNPKLVYNLRIIKIMGSLREIEPIFRRITKSSSSGLLGRKDFMKNNGFPIETKNSKQFFREHLSNLKIIVKNEPVSYAPIWSVKTILNEPFFALAIIDDEGKGESKDPSAAGGSNGIIVARVTSEIMDMEDTRISLEENAVMYPDMRLYIGHVDVKPEHQGKGLCRPVLSYMIKNLKRLGFDMLFIDNASFTKDGVPACVCYYKAGIENKYNMRYYDPKTESFKKMTIDHCLEEITPRERKMESYFYVSDKYNQSGKNKLKNAVKKITALRKTERKVLPPPDLPLPRLPKSTPPPPPSWMRSSGAGKKKRTRRRKKRRKKRKTRHRKTH